MPSTLEREREAIREVPPISPPVRVVTTEDVITATDRNNNSNNNENGKERRVTILQPSRIIYSYPDNSQLVYVLQQSAATRAPRRAAAAAAATTTDPEAEGHTPKSDEDAYADKKSTAAADASPNKKQHGNDGSHAPSEGEEEEPHKNHLFHHRQRKNAHDKDRNNHHHPNNEQARATTTAANNTSACLCGCVGGFIQPERVSDISPENPRIGSPGPVTLFAFGLTTCLYNVHQAGICPLNMTTMGLICFYGGLAQFVGGFFELINKNTIFCTLDVTYGSFWMVTAVSNLMPPNDNVVGTATPDYMGGFFMLWFFFAATMFVGALHSFSYVQILLNFTVALSFLLSFIGHFARSEGVLKAAGYVGIIVGALATYVGMAFSIRDIYGFNLLPLFHRESKGFRVTEW